MLPSEKGHIDRDYQYAKEYGEEKIVSELGRYSEIIGKDWLEVFGEKPVEYSLERFHKEIVIKVLYDECNKK